MSLQSVVISYIIYMVNHLTIRYNTIMKLIYESMNITFLSFLTILSYITRHITIFMFTTIHRYLFHHINNLALCIRCI